MTPQTVCGFFGGGFLWCLLGLVFGGVDGYLVFLLLGITGHMIYIVLLLWFYHAFVAGSGVSRCL